MKNLLYLQPLKHSDCRWLLRLTNNIGHLVLMCVLVFSPTGSAESDNSKEGSRLDLSCEVLVEGAAGVESVLQNAVNDVGGTEEQHFFRIFWESTSGKILELYNSSDPQEGVYYRKAVDAALKYIQHQRQWTPQKITGIFQILEKLSAVTDGNRVSEDDADIIFQDLTVLHLADFMEEDLPEKSRPILPDSLN